MKNLCIIPARGGSKRIPRKNIKPFMGKPIIAYSIEAALKSGLFDEVMVSTDDEEIAKIAKRYGAAIPFLRSRDTSNDYATLADVINEVVCSYTERGYDIKNVCCILATAPLVRSKDIAVAYSKLKDMRCGIVFPIVKYSYPIFRSLKIEGNSTDGGYVSYNWPEYAKVRSQDIQDAYHDSGTFYWYNLHEWTRGGFTRYGLVVEDFVAQDIDTESDWINAEYKYTILEKDGYFLE